MTNKHLFLAALLLTFAGACSKAPEPAGETTPAAPPAAIAAPADDVPAAPQIPATALVEESAGTEPAAVAQPGALAKDIVLAENTAGPASTEWKYKEGEYFNSLTAAQGTSSSPGKIEVAEVFWYGCSHCYNLEPVLADWVKKLPADVSFVRIPVIWNPTNEIHGRAYYTAEALGKLEQVNPAMFRAIHIENQPMTEEKDIQKLFEKFGVSADDFNRTFRSFSVDSQLKRAKDLTVKYRVKGVPLLVIDGKYTTDGPQIKSQTDLLSVAEELVQRERQKKT